ncbi:hypothetical protein CHS0354_035383, partial [Potamilus streckersoni]
MTGNGTLLGQKGNLQMALKRIKSATSMSKMEIKCRVNNPHNTQGMEWNKVEIGKTFYTWMDKMLGWGSGFSKFIR